MSASNRARWHRDLVEQQQPPFSPSKIDQHGEHPPGRLHNGPGRVGPCAKQFAGSSHSLRYLPSWHSSLVPQLEIAPLASLPPASALNILSRICQSKSSLPMSLFFIALSQAWSTLWPSSFPFPSRRRSTCLYFVLCFFVPFVRRRAAVTSEQNSLSASRFFSLSFGPLP